MKVEENLGRWDIVGKVDEKRIIWCYYDQIILYLKL